MPGILLGQGLAACNLLGECRSDHWECDILEEAIQRCREEQLRGALEWAKGATWHGGPSLGIADWLMEEILIEAEAKKLESINPKDLIGAKKLSMTVLPDVAVAHFNHAMQDGARKYGPFNWRDKAVGATTYINAARRHIAQWYDGQETATDSGVHHLGHAAACLAILLDAQACGQLVDDRPKNAGGFCRTLEEINAKCSGS